LQVVAVVVGGGVLLQHLPHRTNVIRRVTSIPPRLEIPKAELFLQTELNSA